ncbi:metal ABC transporter permease [Halothermothrix orenii]|uniref:ABC-3 protein n=1 Tax=Halothermothrix orenii (strain H 168 / OCM 544 / DSM 9562) TaxID=373903 RepID=B8CZ63_HALOH|nr:metal ABC transporter permease [Halothermothrix orenii]ACL70582.1 ABC-3 protein [Halothermothrix orenii H 168]
MLEIFSYSFMLRSMVASLFIGVSCSIIGVFVILKGLSFISAGISHAAFAGVALAFLLGANPLLLGIVFSLLMVWLVGYTNEQAEINMDAAIGILFSLTMGLAVLFIGLMDEYNAELFGYLFGNIISISTTELYIVGAMSLVVIVLIYAFLKEFHFITFDYKMAKASGLPAKKLLYLLLTLTAITIVISLKAVGNLLVIAFLTIPAAGAYQLTHSLVKMIIYSATFGVIGSLAGLFLSYYYNIPSGPGIVLTLGILFVLAVMFSPKRRCTYCSVPDNK